MVHIHPPLFVSECFFFMFTLPFNMTFLHIYTIWCLYISITAYNSWFLWFFCFNVHFTIYFFIICQKGRGLLRILNKLGELHSTVPILPLTFLLFLLMGVWDHRSETWKVLLRAFSRKASHFGFCIVTVGF